MSESNQLTLREDTAVAPVNMEAAALKAIQNPNTPVEQLREYLEFLKDLKRLAAQEVFNRTFARVKDRLPSVPKNGIIPDNRGRVRSRFTKRDDLHRAITPILTEEGMATSFQFKDAGQGRMTCLLTLTCGGYEKVFEDTGPWEMDVPGANPLQKSRAAKSFMKRNILMDAFDILDEGVDDDGSGQGVQPPIDQEQSDEIERCLALIEERDKGATKRFYNLLERQGIANLKDVRQGAQLEGVMAKLRDKLRSLSAK